MISNADSAFEKVWPGNTTPLAVDGTGTTARTLGGWSLYNAAAAARYVRLFDKASAPTMGTDTAKLVVVVPAGSCRDFALPRGVNFVNGLWVSVTGGETDTDNTAPTASDVLVNLFYQ